MTQISRPFQIVLAAFALFVAVWFVALRAHNSSTAGGSGQSASSSSSPSSSAPGFHPAPSGAAEAKAAAAPTHIYTGPAPGVEGLTRAIDKAHGAVAQSQNDAKNFEHAEPSSASAPSGAASASSGKTVSSATTVKRSTSQAGGATVVHTTVVTHAPTTAKHVSSATKPAPAPAKPAPAKPAPAAVKHAAAAPSAQLAVEHELQQGKTVLILFWNPHAFDDVAVHRELPAVQHALGGKVAVHYASAGQVGAYGTITHAVQITQTPTLLIVNPHGQTTVLTGLTDAFAIEQAVAEARHS